MATTAGWQPVFANADEEFLVAYQSATSGEFSLYRAAYYRQHQGKELLGFGNTVAGDGFRVVEVREHDTSAGRHQVSMREQILLSTSGRERLVWSVFAVDGHADPMNLTSRLAYGIRALVRQPTVSVVAVSGDCDPDCDHARDLLQAAATAVLPALLPVSVGSAASAD